MTSAQGEADRSTEPVLAESIRTRFLYPFRFRPESLRAVQQSLRQAQWHFGGAGGVSRPLWAEPKPSGRYQEEFLDSFVERVLSPGLYFQASDPLLEEWRTTGFEITKGALSGRALLDQSKGGGIELFLQPEGVGVLSVCLRLDAPGLGLDRIKTFVYRLSQSIEAKAALLKPAWNGAALQSITLYGLCEELVNAIRATPEADFGQPYKRALLMPWSVVEMPLGITFTSVARPGGVGPENDLSAFASALAQAEEAPHPLPPADDPGVPVAVFHTDHLGAASCMGGVQIVTRLGTPYDAEKPVSRRDRYFMGFLAALFEELILRSLAVRAGKMVVLPASERGEALARLRNDTLHYVATAHLVEISGRHVINRYYSMCQKAHRLQDSLTIIQAAITDLDSAIQSGVQGETLREMNRTQSKVEWIEVFVVSIYSAELCKLMAEAFGFDHAYMGVGGGLVILAAAGLALWRLKPWEAEQEGPARVSVLRGLWVTVAIALGVLAVYIGVGWLGFRHPVAPGPAAEMTAASTLEFRDHPALAARLALASDAMSAKDAARARRELAELSRVHGLAAAAAKARAAFQAACAGECRARPDAREAAEAWANGEFGRARTLWESASAEQAKPKSAAAAKSARTAGASRSRSRTSR